MKILHYLPDVRLADGGIVRAVLDFSNVLAKRGHQVTLLTHNAEDVPATWKGEPGAPSVITFERPAVGNLLFSPAQIRRLGVMLSQAQVVHLHNLWTPAALQLADLAHRRGVGYVQSLHGVLDAWCLAQRPVKKRVFMELFARRAMRRAGAVLCTAKAELAQAERWLGASNGRVVPYIFDLSEFRDLPGAERAQKLIPAAVKSSRKLLYLSRLNYKKGPDVAIRALGLLRKRGVDAHLLMAGTGDAAYVAALEAEAKRSGVTDRVHFLGLVVGDDRLSLFQAADVFLLPTQQENFGFVTVEALACGTPIVTTDGVDIWPELEAGGGSRIVRRGNGRALDEGIADATAELLKEDTLEQRGARGREGVFEWLDGTHVAEQYEDAYQRAARS